MKIILKIYNSNRIGNLSTIPIEIPHTKIAINILKKIIYKRLNIKPSFQRLTYKLYNQIIIILPDEYLLSFFKINNYSTIYLENLENLHIKKFANIRNPISIKYMDKLGYFSPVSKKCHSSHNLTIYKAKSSSPYSDSDKNLKNLSDDGRTIAHNNKNNDESDDEDYQDYELVLSNEKEENFNNNNNNIDIKNNESGYLN